MDSRGRIRDTWHQDGPPTQHQLPHSVEFDRFTAKVLEQSESFTKQQQYQSDVKLVE